MKTKPNNQTHDNRPKDGYPQILEMLRIADLSFRVSLLARLRLKDPKMADSIERDLKKEES